MALSGNTVYITYLLYPTDGNSSYFYSNYIHSVQISDADLSASKLTLSFSDINHFKFLSSDPSIGTGYTANEVYALIQIVKNSGFTSQSLVKPNSANWKYFGITNQILGHTYPNPISALDLISTVFTIPLNAYNIYNTWNIIDIMDYPTKQIIDDNALALGDEYMFLGNVSTQIKSSAFTMELPILLTPENYNTSTNNTWQSNLDNSVIISEIGIYDQNKNLVGIGKLNDPIIKNLNSEGTILFAIDF